MDYKVLVTPDFASGLKLVQALDSAGLNLSVAMWVVDGDYEDWRFAVASRRLDKSDRPYGLLLDALKAAGIPIQLQPTFLLFKMSDPFIRDLRRMYSRFETVEGMQMGAQPVGNRFVEAGILYRVK